MDSFADTESQYGLFPSMSVAVPNNGSLASVASERQACPCVPMAELPPSTLARVKEVRVDDDDAVRLKSLGICVGRRVQLVKGGDPLVVRVLGARVGMSARLAQSVFVEIV